MFSKLLSLGKHAFGVKDMKKAFFEFLNLEAGAVYRGAPQFKQRKYLNVQIADKFKEMQAKRKQQRLMYMQKRKQLLEQKLSTEAKLLTQYEKDQLKKINEQIKSLQHIIQQQNKALAQINQKLQETQADYILIQGPKKLVVLNQITYLRHVNSVPSGVVLTPQSTKVIQNVHYLVTHNLPVPRFKLYQLMPDLFTKEIGELQESVQQLLIEKNLNLFEQTTSHSIRQFSRLRKIRDQRQYLMIKLKQEKQQLSINLSLQADEQMKPHLPYIQKVLRGETPFRNIRHAITALTSTKLNLKLNPQEQAFRDTVNEITKNLEDFIQYCKQYHQRSIQLQFSYIEPPEYVKRHPVLMNMYDQYMEKFTNPKNVQDIPGFLPNLPENDDGRAFMDEKLRKEVEKFDEEFVRLWNQDKQQLISKKKEHEIEFYKISTEILQQYQALEDNSRPIEQFKKLPKRPKRKQQTFMRITMDQLTKMLFLNNREPKKYTLDFFANYFGMTEKEQIQNLYNMLNSVSYLRVMTPQEDQPGGQKQVKQEVLKFLTV